MIIDKGASTSALIGTDLALKAQELLKLAMLCAFINQEPELEMAWYVRKSNLNGEKPLFSLHEMTVKDRHPCFWSDGVEYKAL